MFAFTKPMRAASEKIKSNVLAESLAKVNICHSHHVVKVLLRCDKLMCDKLR